eukprot:275212_1
MKWGDTMMNSITVPMALAGNGQTVDGDNRRTLSFNTKYSSPHAPLVKLGKMLSHRSRERNRGNSFRPQLNSEVRKRIIQVLVQQQQQKTKCQIQTPPPQDHPRSSSQEICSIPPPPNKMSNAGDTSNTGIHLSGGQSSQKQLGTGHWCDDNLSEDELMTVFDKDDKVVVDRHSLESKETDRQDG